MDQKQKQAVEMFEWPFVQDHVRRVRQYLVSELPARFVENMEARTSNGLRASLIESPVELVFWMWWQARILARGPDEFELHLIPQEEIIAQGHRYRLDFWVAEEYPAFAMQAKPHFIPKIAVELDGHEFHERTKEQVARRNERDRDLQSDGWTVLHFSGAEVHRDPAAAVENVFGLCQTHYIETIYRNRK